MPYIAKNISKGYQILLKHQVAPGGELDLEEVFEGFCKPKRSKKNEEPRYAEWAPDEFPQFLERVETDYAADRGVWKFDFTDAPKKNRGKQRTEVLETMVTKREQKKKDAMRAKKNVKRALDDDVTPKELAWLTYGDDAKKIINNISNPQILKHSIKLARNIAGQERVRDLLDSRLMELGDRLG
jgi:hypothetical protein